MTEIVVIETTVSSLDEAKKIASAIIKEHLAGCCQLIPHLTSFYVWKGSFEESSEVIVRLKTFREKVPSLLQFFKKNHPYEVPELLLFSSEGLSQSYVRFIEAAVNP